MCKFHDDVAKDVATDPITNELNRLSYAIALAALASQRVEQTLAPTQSAHYETFSKLSGNTSFQLNQAPIKAIFAESPLPKTYDDVENLYAESVPLLHEKLNTFIQRKHLTQAHLNLPKHKGNYLRFLNRATDVIYHDDKVSPQPVALRPADEIESDFHPLHRTIQDFMAEPGVSDLISKAFTASVSKNFLDAASKPVPFVQKVYNTLPNPMQEFMECTGSICVAGGGSIASHLLTCVALPIGMATIGVSFSSMLGIADSAYINASIGTGLTVGGWALYHHQVGTRPRKWEKAMMACIAIAGFAYNVHSHAGHEMEPKSQIIKGKSVYENKQPIFCP